MLHIPRTINSRELYFVDKFPSFCIKLRKMKEQLYFGIEWFMLLPFWLPLVRCFRCVRFSGNLWVRCRELVILSGQFHLTRGTVVLQLEWKRRFAFPVFCGGNFRWVKIVSEWKVVHCVSVVVVRKGRRVSKSKLIGGDEHVDCAVVFVRNKLWQNFELLLKIVKSSEWENFENSSRTLIIFWTDKFLMVF